jgi:hypothetical protein
MSSFTALVSLAPGADRDALTRDLGAVPARRRLVQPTLPGGYEAGDLIVHYDFAADAQSAAALLDNPRVAHADWAAYEPIAEGRGAPDLRGGVHRVLLLAVEPSTPAETVRRFEAEVRAMPRYIPAIRNWRLSRVTQAGGARAWTHVWEQDYADLGGLLGPYMLHPYHWARVDRWFDPECPERIVDPRLCHGFCGFERSVLGSD